MENRVGNEDAKATICIYSAAGLINFKPIAPPTTDGRGVAIYQFSSFP
jgi:hypothetical protein